MTSVSAVSDSSPAAPSFADVTAAVLERLPAVAGPLTVSVNGSEPTGIDSRVHVTVPDAPTAGVAQLQLPGAASETKVVPVGRVSVSSTSMAGSGPPFVTVMA